MNKEEKKAEIKRKLDVGEPVVDPDTGRIKWYKSYNEIAADLELEIWNNRMK